MKRNENDNVLVVKLRFKDKQHRDHFMNTHSLMESDLMRAWAKDDIFAELEDLNERLSKCRCTENP
jgi:hypothetical protein